MEAKSTAVPVQPAWTRAGAAYGAALFLLALVLLAAAFKYISPPMPEGNWLPALFFFGYGLFTISIGYREPNRHYYSFDRVSQVASILVLGPVDAAWINGLASLVYPVHRLWLGVPPRNVLYASLANSGIMTLMILAAGFAYEAVGGVIPLRELDGSAVLALLVLVVVMQVLNDVAMLGLSLLSRRDVRGWFSAFSHALELCSCAAAVQVAVVYNRLETGAFILLLVVLGIVMLALRQFAVMRTRLERIVDERTQSLREKTAELERMAMHDNLTGLFNRRYADSWVSRHLELQRNPALTVALADIDFFKQINDRHSHATGDEVLRRVAGILQLRCRSTDIVARYGGEEFLLCFPRTELREALALCEQLRADVAGADWSDLQLAGSVTLSFGLATRRADSTLESLLRLADERLYAAKNAGRNRVVA
jgi:diguanylate cyclase (GGDEF)-like protein